MNYVAKIEKEDGAILVSFPDAPGCQTFGHDLEEAGAMAKDALQGWLETQLQVGRLPPRPKFSGRGLVVHLAPELTLKLELRWAREESGLTQSELAKLVGVTQQRIAALENPDVEVKLSTAARVLEALGRSLDVMTTKDAKAPMRRKLPAAKKAHARRTAHATG